MTRRAPPRNGVVATATRGIRFGAAEPTLDTDSLKREFRERASCVKQALHLHRVARRYRRLWVFYVEHNLFEEARLTRLVMIGHLRGACAQWRSVLRGTR